MSKFDTVLDKRWAALERTLGRSPSHEESERLYAELYEAWLAERRFDDLVAHLKENYELEGGHIDCITLAKALRDAGEVERVHSLFRGLISSRSRAFWRSWPQAEQGQLGHMRDAARYYASCMEVYAEYYHNLWSLQLEQAQADLKQEMLRFQARQRPLAATRKLAGMDDRKFWALLTQARATAGSAGEFAAELDARFATLVAEDIARFDALLNTKLAALKHWDLVAYANLARGGCSDDSFDYFCAWLVAMGPKVYKAALRGPEALLKCAPDCWDLQCEELLSLAAQAYRSATGSALPRSVTPPTPRAGTAWREAELSARYPVLFAHYVLDDTHPKTS